MRRDAAVLADLAAAVEDREVAATRRAAVAGRPDDRVDAGGARSSSSGAEIGLTAGERLGIEHLGGQPEPLDGMVDAGEHATHPPVGSIDDGASVGAERTRGFRRPPATGRRGRRPAPAGWRGRGCVWSGRPTSWSRRLASSSHDIADVVDRLVERADRGRATRRCPCLGSGVAAGCGDRPRASRGGRSRCSSSASCTPVAEAPTTSTPPVGRSSGLR